MIRGMLKCISKGNPDVIDLVVAPKYNYNDYPFPLDLQPSRYVSFDVLHDWNYCHTIFTMTLFMRVDDCVNAIRLDDQFSERGYNK